MSEVSTDKKLKGKDLITIGIFSAIYFVINFAFMLLGGIHPVLWMLMQKRSTVCGSSGSAFTTTAWAPSRFQAHFLCRHPMCR